MAKTFLAAGEERGFIASLDDNDAVRIETGLGERRREQVRAGDAPQDLPACACGNAGGEENGGCAMQGARGASGDFMQRGEIETLAGKGAVDSANPEWKHRRVDA